MADRQAEAAWERFNASAHLWPDDEMATFIAGYKAAAESLKAYRQEVEVENDRLTRALVAAVESRDRRIERLVQIDQERSCAIVGCEEVTTYTLVTGLDVGDSHMTVEIPLCPGHDRMRRA